MRRAVSLLVLVCALLAAPALAPAPERAAAAGEAQIIRAQWLTDSLQLAEIYWADRDKVCVNTDIEFDIIDEFRGPLMGVAEIGGCLDSFDECTSSGCPYPVEITIESVLASQGWRNFCVLILHEYGHLVGEEHTSQPYALMTGPFLHGQPKFREPCRRAQLR